MKRSLQLVALMLLSAGAAHAAGRLPPVTTTPEPMTLGLVAGGVAIVGVGAWLRRKR
ncbi:PEP motif putative anchor domain protein [Gemmatirosa kalamazoonensis]|uniref:PEP motif putative anchor domain protein n=1 Tax=Gemmatirosa kalamazoonensis TaxID=861299 RepID=W0RF69_9BACT|nr:PEP-CTERM sorting domain-containing protein [Gemmatirosa kalamazoonensis]AHG88985.1 PEP motif putative anchor domain protein [Gemmatirosa kalamazoonensis]